MKFSTKIVCIDLFSGYKIIKCIKDCSENQEKIRTDRTNIIILVINYTHLPEKLVY